MARMMIIALVAFACIATVNAAIQATTFADVQGSSGEPSITVYLLGGCCHKNRFGKFEHR